MPDVVEVTIGWLDALKQGMMVLERYRYVGRSTVVEWDEVNLSYIKVTGRAWLS
jgi:hypothetical protein